MDETRWMLGYHSLISSSFDVGLTSEKQAEVRDCASRLNAAAL